MKKLINICLIVQKIQINLYDIHFWISRFKNNLTTKIKMIQKFNFNG
jgi:hypothetical protein